jgi:hypothetical protein
VGSKRDCESAELEGAGEEWVGERGGWWGGQGMNCLNGK